MLNQFLTRLYTYLQTCGDLVLLTACSGVAYKHTVKLHTNQLPVPANCITPVPATTLLPVPAKLEADQLFGCLSAL